MPQYQIESTTDGHGYIGVYVNGQRVSQHTSASEAGTAAMTAAANHPGADVYTEQDNVTHYTFVHHANGTAPKPEPAPAPEPEPAPAPKPEPKPQPQPGEAIYTAKADGQAIRAAVAEGTQALALWADGTPSTVAVYHYDGAVWAKTTGNDVDIVNERVVVGGQVISSGESFTLLEHKGTRPLWYRLPTADLDALDAHYPKLAGGEKSDWPGFVERADFGRMGHHGFVDGEGGTGERTEIGPQDEWQGNARANPSAANVRAMRILGDAAGPVIPTLLDPDTLQMVDPREQPGNTFLWALRDKSDNYFGGYSGADQMHNEAAHFPPIPIMQAHVYGHRYYVDHLVAAALFTAVWWQNPGYRDNDGAGASSFGRDQTRGWAWTLRTVASAANAAQKHDHYMADYMQTLLDQMVSGAESWLAKNPEVLAHYPKYPRYKHVDNTGRNRGHGVAPWENHYVHMALDHAARQTSGAMQKRMIGLMARFTQFAVQAALSAHPWLGSNYTVVTIDEDGNLAKSWQDIEQFTAAIDGQFRNRLTTDPGTCIGYPTVGNNYTAMYRYAVWVAAYWGVDGGTAALAEIDSRYVADNSVTCKYHPVF